VYLGAYPVAGAALLLLCALEAVAACRLRGVVRRRFNIDGSACEDGVLSCLFTSCVAAQMLRHLRTTPSSVVTPAGSVRI
jgi:Cys-rich protein (TIGR01571 family)